MANLSNTIAAATGTVESIEAIGAALLAEHRSAGRDRRFAERHGIAGLPAAYDAQDAFVARLADSEQTTVAGYKLGLTSTNMQQTSGITHPVAGAVLASAISTTPHRLRIADFGRLALEFEIVVRLGRDLSGPAPIGIDQVAAATDAVAPTIEIIDIRDADLKAIDVLSLVAQNTWSTGFTIGELHKSWPDLASVVGRVALNGKEIDQGIGSMALGHPFASVAWLANHFITRGKTLKAGSIVSTGNIATVRFPIAGERYRFSLDGLGSVEVEVGP